MKSRLSLAGIAMLTIAATADAQERGVTFGIGTSLNPTAIFAGDGDLALFNVGLGNLYFPLIIGSSFKLEPEFGLLRLSEKTTDGTTSSESSATLTRLGIGAFWVTPIRESFRVYVGPRVGIVRNSESSSFGTGPWFSRCSWCLCRWECLSLIACFSAAFSWVLTSFCWDSEFSTS